MAIKYVDKEEYEDVVAKKDLIVDFYADWCGPCRMLSPILEELSDEINIIKVNIDKREDIAVLNGVMTIPTLIFYKKGKEVNKLIGYQTKEDILHALKKVK